MKKYSCKTALISLVCNWLTAINEEDSGCISFFFTLVNHERLLHKLASNKLTPKLSTYHYNRQQKVHVSRKLSGSRKVITQFAV